MNRLSTGTLEKSFNGVSHVFKTACHQSTNLPSLILKPPLTRLLQLSLSTPPLSRVQKLRAKWRFLQNTGHSRMCKQLATQLPPATCVYPLSIPEQKATEEYIQEALQQRFIRPSTSPVASSFFFVARKDGGLRPCIDYCHLNSQTVKYSYPLPLVPAALEQLRGARIFSTLALRSAYNLNRNRRGDEWKAAFVTPSGYYEYWVMPYGLSNSPYVFQGYMNEVFREFLQRFVIVYIDDILIYSRNLAEHHQHVKQVLEKLCQHYLYLKLEKCEFHTTSVHFLGYVIDQHSIQMDQRKVETNWNWPQPVTVKELQRFLGFANFYRRFINNYSLLSSSFTSLLKGWPKSLSWKLFIVSQKPSKPLRSWFIPILISRSLSRWMPLPPVSEPSSHSGRVILQDSIHVPSIPRSCPRQSKTMTSVIVSS